MGRMFRYTLQEDVAIALDVSFRTSGKLLIKNFGTRDCRMGYDPYDIDQTTGVNFWTIEAGEGYAFDMSPEVGFLSQGQQLFIICTTGTNVIEMWVANEG